MRKLIIAYVMLLAHSVCAQQNNLIDSLEKIAAAHKQDTFLAKLYLDLGRKYQASGNIESAIAKGHQSATLSTQLNYSQGILIANDFLSNNYLMIRNVNEAVRHNKIALQIARELKNYSEEARAYNVGARIELVRSTLDSAILLCDKALDAVQKTKDTLMLAKVYSNYGYCYQVKSEFKKASEHYLLALKYAELAKDTILPAAVLGNLGVLHRMLGNTRGAITYNLQALKLRIRNKQLQDEIGAYSNLAACYDDLKMEDSAMYYFHLTFSRSNENGIVHVAAMAAHNLASHYQHTLTDSALYYLNFAIDKYKMMEDEENLSPCYHTQGEIFYALGEKQGKASQINYIQKAISSFHASLAISERLRQKEYTVQSYRALAACYNILKQPQKAYDYMQAYVLLDDSMRSEQISGQIAEMQAKYETEKKDRELAENKVLLQQNEIDLTRKSNTNRMIIAGVILVLLAGAYVFYSFRMRKKKEAEDMMLKSRLNISQGLHDDLGSTLSSISVYSQVAKSLNEKQEREELSEMLGKISTTSNEMVSEMNDIVWAINPKNDRIERMIQRMESFAMPLLATRNIHFKLHYDAAIISAAMGMEKRKNLYLIFKEAINNAFKYSGCSVVDVQLTLDKNLLTMQISDDGVGFDVEHEIAGVKHTLSGNGLENMRMRVGQMNGEFRLTSQPGRGTEIRVSFPIP